MDKSSVASPALAQAIEALYYTFVGYSLSPTFGDCQWLSNSQVKAIQLKTLREIDAADLNHYVCHAWRCGNTSDFKYLLPRILQLFTVGELDVIPQMLFLDLADENWTEVERQTIYSYLYAFWNELINSFPFVLMPDEALCCLAMLYADLTELLDIWDANHSLASLRQLALFATQATYCSSWQYYPVQMKQVIDWLLRPQTVETLEKAALEYTSDVLWDEFIEAIRLINEWKKQYQG